MNFSEIKNLRELHIQIFNFMKFRSIVQMKFITNSTF